MTTLNDTPANDTADRLLTEVERQQKYLAKLPKDYKFPLFNAAGVFSTGSRDGLAGG